MKKIPVIDAEVKKDSIRALKKQILRILESSCEYHDLLKLSGGSLLRIINTLFSFLYHRNPVVKWNAVSAMGSAVSDLEEYDIESARNIIRRLMWNLNDESGGIGWGSVEAMGDILAKNRTLALEYWPVLLSYAREDGNFQEHEFMQRGVLWGIGRFCQSWPELPGDDAVKHIMPFLESEDEHVRGFAAWIMGYLKAEESMPRLEELKSDESIVQIFMEEKLIDTKVKDLAEEALIRIQK
jgi:HEAT repeat protein